MEDDDAAGLLEVGHQTGVEVLRLAPALPRVQERADHVRLHRPRTEQRDVDDEVGEAVGGELADQLALPGRLDLEAAQGAGRLHQRVGVGVVQGHLLPVVEVDPDPVHALDLVDRVRHRRLHTDAEHVELEQPHLLDVLLVELAHREAQPAGLHRRAVEQGGAGQDHAAGVHGDVPRQAVERLDQLEQQLHPGCVEPLAAQLGQVADGGPGVARPDVREGLGQHVDLARRHAEGGGDVADRVPHPVGLGHGHARHPVGAEAFEDPFVHLGAPRRLHVDVDVGQLRAQRRAEALHEQAVLHGVDPADAEQVGHQAARARAPRRDPHAVLADEVAHRRHGEEVGGIAQPGDDAELVGEPGPDPVEVCVDAPG